MGHRPEAMATEEKLTSQPEKDPDQDRREASGGERKRRRKTHGTTEWTHGLEQPRRGKGKGEAGKAKGGKGKEGKGSKGKKGNGEEEE